MIIAAIKYFDCFSGIGGLRSGLEQAGGYECVGFCEIDKHAETAYRAMYNTEKEVFYRDITEIKGAELPDFDLFVGGFPCQPFSVAGKRLGFEDTRGTIEFTTPWSAPVPILQALSEKFPDITISSRWADEDVGVNTGEAEFKDGEISELTRFWVHSKEEFELAAELWGLDLAEEGFAFNEKT